ncbi:MAG: D-TA family PLP-dependent enzyme [Pirellulaceae bacterium]|nr:D-TA family PLP-dependent enzyme [Pirellulaceae bacterium]
MEPCYAVQALDDIVTPALLVFREIVETNLRLMIRMAGGPERLRPHCKTHKIRQIAEWQLALGITRHKCATLAEAEMLALAGVRDILLAYNPVGPNIPRVARFVETYPEVRFAVTADHPLPVEQLGRTMENSPRPIGVLLDLDTGMHRTGVAPGPEAVRLYRQIAAAPGLEPAGLHVYDGHHHQKSFQARVEAVHESWKTVASFRNQLLAQGLPVPRVVVGGTGTFPVFAAMDDPGLELSPGTAVFYDAGYTEAFPDLDFEIAALLLTRVISRPAADLITFDLGYKACAADPPLENRLVFPDLPDARLVRQNEEHMVVRSRTATHLQPGDFQMAVPWHICPTVALHKLVHVIDGRRVAERWDVLARDRWLTI